MGTHRRIQKVFKSSPVIEGAGLYGVCLRDRRHGPIVMTTQKELKVAFEEYREGTFIQINVDVGPIGETQPPAVQNAFYRPRGTCFLGGPLHLPLSVDSDSDIDSDPDNNKVVYMRLSCTGERGCLTIRCEPATNYSLKKPTDRIERYRYRAGFRNLERRRPWGKS